MNAIRCCCFNNGKKLILACTAADLRNKGRGYFDEFFRLKACRNIFYSEPAEHIADTGKAGVIGMLFHFPEERILRYLHME